MRLAIIFILTISCYSGKKSLNSLSVDGGLLIWVGGASAPAVRDSMKTIAAVQTYKCLQLGCRLREAEPLFLIGVPPIAEKIELLGGKVIDFEKKDLSLHLFFNYERADSKMVLRSVLVGEKPAEFLVQVSVSAEMTKNQAVFIMKVKSTFEAEGETSRTPREFFMSSAQTAFRKDHEGFKIFYMPFNKGKYLSEESVEVFTCLEANMRKSDGQIAVSPANFEIIIESQVSPNRKLVNIFGDQKEIFFKGFEGSDGAAGAEKVELARSYHSNRVFVNENTDFKYTCTGEEFSIEEHKTI